MREWTFFKTSLFDGVFFVLLFFFGILLMLGLKHRETGSQLQITSDKAGYYVYLPATFIYHWDMNKFPKDLDMSSMGFSYNTPHQKVVTKYPCGTAIMLSPFWLVIHAIAIQQNLKPDGFSEFYQWMILIAPVFYMVSGLYFLFRFLQYYYSKGLSMATVLLLFAGTNLYYYSLDEGLMAHSVSFFLFSLFLFLLKKFLSAEKRSFWLLTGIYFVVAMVVLVRPTGILIFSCFFFLDASTIEEFTSRLRSFFKPLHFLVFILVFFIVFLPQFLYWKYLSGHYLVYSYGNETFRNLANPRMIPAWFSPLNGFFLYTPLAVTFIIGIVIMILKKQLNGIFTGILFLVASYVFASWECWYFGGSFGYRSLVEFYAILAIPFAFFLKSVMETKNRILQIIAVILILASVWYNQKMTLAQEWNTSSTWAWDDYLRHLDKAGICSFREKTYTYREDFENFAVDRPYRERTFVHSPTQAGITDTTSDYPIFSRQLAFILKEPVKKVTASIWIHPGGKSKTGMKLYFLVDDWQHKIHFSRELEIDNFTNEPNRWTKVHGAVELPGWLEKGFVLNVGLSNREHIRSVCFDDLVLKFE